MRYAEMLEEMIARSHLSLQQISNKCKAHDVNVVPSYISKLQRGNQSPPSEQVSAALAKACGGDPESLIYQGYIEKAPAFIQECLRNLAETFRVLFRKFGLSEMPPEISALLEQQIKTMSDYALIRLLLDQNMLDQIGPTTILQDGEDPNLKILVNPLLQLQAPDDAMAPIIPQGARIQIMNDEAIENGNIVVVVLPDESYRIRRYIETPVSPVLVAESLKYPPMTMTADAQVVILGKVKSVTVDLEQKHSGGDA